MPELNLDIDFLHHPKMIRLASLVGSEAGLYLIRIWCHAGKYHCTDGALLGYSVTEIEGICAWKGEPGQLVEAMTKPGIGLLEPVKDGYKIHDWKEHQGHLAAYKKRAKSGAKARWGKLATRRPVSSASSTASSTAQPPVKQSPILTNDTNDTNDTTRTVREKAAPLTRSQRRAVLDAYVIPEETRTWARLEFKLEIPDDVLREFKDFWRMQKHLRTDWDATFRNRVRQLVGIKALKPGNGMIPVGSDWKQAFLANEQEVSA